MTHFSLPRFRLPSLNPQQHRSPSSTQTSSPLSTLNSTGGSSGSNSDVSMEASSPGFEVLYEELSDWLKEMQINVSDCNDLCVSQTHIEHMCKVSIRVWQQELLEMLEC